MEELQKLLLAFIPLFVAIDPIGLAAIFIWMTREMPVPRTQVVANHAMLTSALVCLGFLFLGKLIFKFLGITVYDFQIAGGLILFILAARDIIGVAAQDDLKKSQHIGVVPLGMPLIAGPASITTLLILTDSAGWGYTLLALALNLGLVYLAFRFSKPLMRQIGDTGLHAFSKIISLLLAAISVSMIVKGIQGLNF